jgi:hypothetical protein
MMTRPLGRDNGGQSSLQANHEQQRHLDAGFEQQRHLAENQGGPAQVANDEHLELPAQSDLQRSMQALSGREEGRIGLTDDSPLETRRGREIFNQTINDAGLSGPLDPGARAILAPQLGQARDIGYSDDYVENSREYHQRLPIDNNDKN